MKLWRNVSTYIARRRIDADSRGIKVSGPLWLHGRGVVVVGNDTRFEGGTSGIELFAIAGGRIDIGSRCQLAEGVSIEANASVKVGNDVQVGPFAKILDNDFHSLRGDRHRRPAALAIVIEDGVQIGERAIILPGVVIGAGAHIHARAVVTRRVPPGVEVAGNPARQVRR